MQLNQWFVSFVRPFQTTKTVRRVCARFPFVFALPITLGYTMNVLETVKSEFLLFPFEPAQSFEYRTVEKCGSSSSTFSHRSIDFRNLFIFVKNEQKQQKDCVQCLAINIFFSCVARTSNGSLKHWKINDCVCNNKIRQLRV